MGHFQALSIIYLFFFGIFPSSPYNARDPHQKHDGICGGHCRGDGKGWGNDPCSPFVLPAGSFHDDIRLCEWANDNCCPPYGNGTEWTTTTIPTTTTTTSAPKKEEDKSGVLKHWKIILIVLGVIVGLAIIGGIAYFLYRKICSKNKTTQENKYNPPALETPGSNYAYAEENPNFGTSDDFYGSGADTTYYP